MPGLNKANLKTGIKNLTDALWNNPTNLTPDQCRDKFATDLSNLIDTYVKTGIVSVTVNTTGTSTAQTGTGTGNIT